MDDEKARQLEEVKRIVVPILKRNGVIRAGVFGSYARGEATKKSDVDILIKVKAKKFSLFDLVRIELELKKALGKNVDLLTYKGIDPCLKEQILGEEVKII